MFTGLIETLGKVNGRAENGGGDGAVGRSRHNRPDRRKIGDSIDVNGVCLTVSKLSGSIGGF